MKDKGALALVLSNVSAITTTLLTMDKICNGVSKMRIREAALNIPQAEELLSMLSMLSDQETNLSQSLTVKLGPPVLLLATLVQQVSAPERWALFAPVF